MPRFRIGYVDPVHGVKEDCPFCPELHQERYQVEWYTHWPLGVTMDLWIHESESEGPPLEWLLQHPPRGVCVPWNRFLPLRLERFLWPPAELCLPSWGWTDVVKQTILQEVQEAIEQKNPFWKELNTHRLPLRITRPCQYMPGHHAKQFWSLLRIPSLHTFINTLPMPVLNVWLEKVDSSHVWRHEPECWSKHTLRVFVLLRGSLRVTFQLFPEVEYEQNDVFVMDTSYIHRFQVPSNSASSPVFALMLDIPRPNDSLPCQPWPEATEEHRALQQREEDNAVKTWFQRFPWYGVSLDVWQRSFAPPSSAEKAQTL